MRPLTFSCHIPGLDRRHFVTEADVRVVLGRLPEPLWERLRAVHFNDRAMGPRRLGYVTRGRHEIALCALPPRVSLAAYLERGQSPSQFGAVRGGQWPTLAVRRFLLYDVFLHELGHMQVVDSEAKATRRKFASGTRAQEFAERWCRELWSRPFDHPDPVHNPPSREETEALLNGWRAAHADYKRAMLREKAERSEEAVLLLTRAVERHPGHEMALERLGVLTYAGCGTTESSERAIDLLSSVIRLDPTRCDATLFLALALARQDREADARSVFERAMRLDRSPPLAMSMYADALADWGCFAEAEALFLNAIKRDGRFALAIRDYGRTLLRDHNPDAEDNLGRAISLFERAVALDPDDAESHYRLGDALLGVDGQIDRAIAHLGRAVRLDPAHVKAAEALAEAEAEREARDA